MSAIVGTDQYINYFHNPHGIIQGAIGSALAAGSIIGAAGAVSRHSYDLVDPILTGVGLFI